MLQFNDAMKISNGLELPCDKHDTVAVARLAALGYPTISPVLAELLTWLQDANWPVAKPVSDLFVAIGTPVVPLLIAVFDGEDAVWKYWCLTGIVRRLPPPALSSLRATLERLAKSPTEIDQREEVDLAARDLLHELANRSSGA